MTYARFVILIAFIFVVDWRLDSAHAAPNPIVVRRISSKLGCALFSENGKFKLGTLSSRGVFRQLTKAKISAEPQKYSKGSAQCKRLRGLGGTLSSLPSAAAFLALSTSGSEAVSGTPPVLSTLGSGGAAPYFWRSGVLDRVGASTPTADDCEEFYGSAVASRSAGLASCKVGEDLGKSLFVGKAVETLGCYIKRAVSSTTYRRGLSLVSGAIPGGLVDALFDPPAGASSRLVKVSFVGLADTIFVRIKGASQNAIDGNSYSMERWSCRSGAVAEYQVATIRSSDSLYSSSTQMSSLNAQYRADVEGYLSTDGVGGIGIDLSRERGVSMVSVGGGVSFSSDLEVDGDSVFRQKVALHGTTQQRHAYQIYTVGGASESDMALQETSVKYRILQSGDEISAKTTSAEYQDTAYLSVLTSSLASGLSSVDLTSDPFYNATPSTGFDSTPYSCDASPNVELQIDITATAVASAITSCALSPTTFTNMCSDTDALFGEIQFATVCPG